MTDIYQRLAKRLDELPQGYPATDSGVELKILQKLFTPEDAEMALKMKALPETAEQIAERLGKPVAHMRSVLDNMAEKGQIGSLKTSGQQMYMLFPFIPGIYEFQAYRLDKELTSLFETYYPTLIKAVGGYKPGLARTIPINSHVEAETRIKRYEDVRAIMEQAKSFLVMECICRKEQRLEGHGCDHTLENCLSFSTEENAYDYFSIGGRIITKEEALSILDKTEEEGLIHNAFYNVKEGHAAICNCCSCCCGVLRGVKNFGASAMLAKSDFIAVIDQETCSQCGVCKDERCQMDAIIEENNGYKVQPDICIGCGVCAVTCPTESIKLIQKHETEQESPPDNIIDWYVERSANRGIELKLE
jgi:electron transport complex protein RnfB